VTLECEINFVEGHYKRLDSTNHIQSSIVNHSKHRSILCQSFECFHGCWCLWLWILLI